jgi:hypothetical protein
MPVGEKKIKRGLHAEEPGEDRHFTHFERPAGSSVRIPESHREHGRADLSTLGAWGALQ